jgi:phage shock protein PspC (stress-responsive transcriptional regulator)
MSDNTATQSEPTTPGASQPSAEATAPPSAPFTPPVSPTGPPAGAPAGPPPRRLTRVREGKMLAGVSTGLARYLGIDPVVVRVGFALTTVFGGAGFLAYIACWVLMPQD